MRNTNDTTWSNSMYMQTDIDRNKKGQYCNIKWKMSSDPIGTPLHTICKYSLCKCYLNKNLHILFAWIQSGKADTEIR